MVRADDRPVYAPVPVGAAHEAVSQQPHCPALGEAKQRLPGLGRVAPAGGPAAGWHGSGLLVQRSRGPLPSAALWTPSGALFLPQPPATGSADLRPKWVGTRLLGLFARLPALLLGEQLATGRGIQISRGPS